MELKDFVKGVISDIANAITELNEGQLNSDLFVNPKKCTLKKNEYSYCDDGRQINDIEFNLSISASDTVDKGGGIKIDILKAGISKETNTGKISTIKFSIPVAFPGCDGPKQPQHYG